MKTKWYFSTFILILTFLGICHHQISLPNQEILVQFNTKEVTAEQTQNAVAAIKMQLQGLGVETILVREAPNGSLKISYHSIMAVESIKKLLSDEASLALDFTAFGQHKKSSKSPSKESSKSYNLDVYELQHPDNSNSVGAFVISQKQDYDRFFNPNSGLYLYKIDLDQTDNIIKRPYKVIKNDAVVKENTPYVFPEVRAGPSATATS